ncbi:tetratricopeptide repeat protein [Kiritimatiellota bacterium B12222]|nr:tetratricopeptide repeat protein [Kiritimatiellota bacterium B12222]
MSCFHSVADESVLLLAQSAAQNRLLDLAVAHYEELIETAESSVLQYQAELDLAQVYLANGKLDEVKTILSQLDKAPQSALFSEVLLMNADIALIEEKPDEAQMWLDQLPILNGEMAFQRKRLQVRTFRMQNKLDEAIALLLGEGAVSDLPPVLQMDLAECWLIAGEEESALQIWQVLSAGPLDDLLTQQALLQQAKWALMTQDDAGARGFLEKLTVKGELLEELEPEVYPVLIRLLEDESAYLEAAKYLKAFEVIVADPLLKKSLQALRAQDLILGGDLENASRLLQELIALYGDQADVARVQLLLARTYAQADILEAARDAYTNYLSVFTDSQGLLEAQMGLATVQERLQEYLKAERLYEKVLNEVPEDSELRALCLLKWADMAFALKKMPVAAERYELFLDDYPDHPEVPSVLIKFAVSLAENEQLPQALNVLSGIRLRYPESEFAEKALMQRAVLLQKGLRPEQALGAYDSYLELYPEGRYVVDAMTDKGITAYRLGLFDLALRQFREVSMRFPDSPRAEQAQSLIGWTNYLLGDDEAARKAGREFIKKYPQSIYAFEVRFWLAELAFNHGEYPQAASEFQKLSQTEVIPALQSKACYLAGRALLADKKMELALKEFRRSRELNPEAPFAADVLFYMGDALTEMGSFDEAILIFDQLIRSYPESYLVYAARGRMGDCQYTLGEKDQSRYLEALNSYKLVEESKSAGLELRIQAMYKVGRTLNALDRKVEAQRQLEKMIQFYMANRKSVGEEASTWFLRAVADVAQSYEQAGEYRSAIKIYEQLRDSGLPQSTEGARRVDDLRREHRILF